MQPFEKCHAFYAHLMEKKLCGKINWYQSKKSAYLQNVVLNYLIEHARGWKSTKKAEEAVEVLVGTNSGILSALSLMKK